MTPIPLYLDREPLKFPPMPNACTTLEAHIGNWEIMVMHDFIWRKPTQLCKVCEVGAYRSRVIPIGLDGISAPAKNDVRQRRQTGGIEGTV